jgi:hypothetical protein
MFPFVTYGMTDASTTRSPSTPYTPSDPGSVTASGPVPMAQVQDGWSAVSASRATQARISSSVETEGPGDSSPSLNGANASWVRMLRAIRIASPHSRLSVSVDR